MYKKRNHAYLTTASLRKHNCRYFININIKFRSIYSIEGKYTIRRVAGNFEENVKQEDGTNTRRMWIRPRVPI